MHKYTLISFHNSSAFNQQFSLIGFDIIAVSHLAAWSRR